jgi:glycogen debranching enzyme
VSAVGGDPPATESPAEPPRRVGWRRGDNPEALLTREWLVGNGLGGYASGTVGGAPTRRFHGLLIAALPAPLGRTMMLSYLGETLRFADGTRVPLAGLDTGDGPITVPEALVEFRLENGLPIWRFEHGGAVLEKRVVVTHRQNTARLSYRLLAAPEPLTLVLEPAVGMRPHEGRVEGDPPSIEVSDGRDGVRVVDPTQPQLPALHVAARSTRFATLLHRPRTFQVHYRIEEARGYDGRGPLRALGLYELPLAAGGEAVLTASTESWDSVHAVGASEAASLENERRQRLLWQAHPALRAGAGAELALAADQFVILPQVRPADEARLRAEGDDARTVIAGYHWFTDWGRDTMISLEGLTLLTGRRVEARNILHTFAHHIRDGLIPNLFPEGQSEGLYHTADATLWFFHALDRYERVSGELETRRFLLPKLVEVAQKHFTGTRFGIGVDNDDGLLKQGADGYQLTWMDAKVGDWVVTPRRGKAVEINALFYNALVLLARWLRDEEAMPAASTPRRPMGLDAAEVEARAERLRASFNRRFWNAAAGCLYDVVDVLDGPKAGGNDDAIRPNQLLAVSLPNPVLDRDKWVPVLQLVRDKLATSFGLRSLAPGHPDYKPRYDGDRRARDAAYHQGTVWGWLVGPFVDAWLKTFTGDRAGASRVLGGLEQELSEAGLGTISEIFDAEPPFTPRGCVAQAWSVAETLRALVLTAD